VKSYAVGGPRLEPATLGAATETHQQDDAEVVGGLLDPAAELRGAGSLKAGAACGAERGAAQAERHGVGKQRACSLRASMAGGRSH
jgi:hypothetical protein